MFKEMADMTEGKPQILKFDNNVDAERVGYLV